MKHQNIRRFELITLCILLVALAATAAVSAQQGTVVSRYGPTNQNQTLDPVKTATAVVSEQQEKVVSSYGPTNQDQTFDQIKAARMAVKDERAEQHMELLNSRYDLTPETSAESVMSGGKPLPVGPTAKLQEVTWEQLG